MSEAVGERGEPVGRPLFAAMRTIAVALAFAVVFLIVENVVVAWRLDRLDRVPSDFSARFLQRKMDRLARRPPAVLVLGDSVFWGYRVAPDQAAIAILRRRGCDCENLSYKGSSPANYYALLRIALAAGVLPKMLLLQVDDKVFNPSDDAYQKLHPAVGRLAAPLLDPADRSSLGLPRDAERADPVAGALANVWLPYAMRSDVREAFLGEDRLPPVPHLTSDMFEGDYDLTPLTDRNLSVRFLEMTAELARSRRIAVVAFVTPVNHRLLHDYIDDPAYRSNLDFIERSMRARGARVVDDDAAFPPSEFFDESHLTPHGNEALATALESALKGSVGTRVASGERSAP